MANNGNLRLTISSSVDDLLSVPPVFDLESLDDGFEDVLVPG